jgi:hypothetical protein
MREVEGLLHCVVTDGFRRRNHEFRREILQGRWRLRCGSLRGKGEESMGISGVYMGRPFGIESNGGEGDGHGDGFQWRSNGRRLGKALTGGSHLSVVEKKKKIK